MANLTAIKAVVPSIKGDITVSDSLSSGQFVLNIVSPPGTKALVGIPKKRPWQSVTANNQPVWNQGSFRPGIAGVTGAGEDSLYVMFNVDPGTWRFVALLTPVGVSQQPEREPSSPYSVNMRKVAGGFAFDPGFAGKTKKVEVYDLSGRLVCSKAVMNDNINLQKDFCLPDNVYVVKVKTVR
jgi:hypothetical protein